MNETTGKFEKTDEALKVDPLGMGIIFFLFGILIVQAVGMIIHRLNTLVEALHEVSELEAESALDNSNKFKRHRAVLEEGEWGIRLNALSSPPDDGRGALRQGAWLGRLRASRDSRRFG